MLFHVGEKERKWLDPRDGFERNIDWKMGLVMILLDLVKKSIVRTIRE
jgi:hypothetical protein